MLVLFSAGISFGQDLDKHKWENRVLLITSVDEKDIHKQVQILSKDKDGLKERKLTVYKVLPHKYAKGIDNYAWNKNQQFFGKVKRKRSTIEVILIGLDGGVKLRQTRLVSLEKLFALIDGMPMRRAEMKRN